MTQFRARPCRAVRRVTDVDEPIPVEIDVSAEDNRSAATRGDVPPPRISKFLPLVKITHQGCPVGLWYSAARFHAVTHALRHDRT
jgi:hypothetical protein